MRFCALKKKFAIILVDTFPIFDSPSRASAVSRERLDFTCRPFFSFSYPFSRGLQMSRKKVYARVLTVVHCRFTRASPLRPVRAQVVRTHNTAVRDGGSGVRGWYN